MLATRLALAALVCAIALPVTAEAATPAPVNLDPDLVSQSNQQTS
jgi:hypothetical protein